MKHFGRGQEKVTNENTLEFLVQTNPVPDDDLDQEEKAALLATAVDAPTEAV